MPPLKGDKADPKGRIAAEMGEDAVAVTHTFIASLTVVDDQGLQDSAVVTVAND